MVRNTNWENKEESLERMRELYPNMKEFLINICYDLYEQSKTDENLQNELQKIDVSVPESKPNMKDYDGYEYDTEQKIEILPPAPVWKCQICSVVEKMGGGVSNRSEELPEFCEFCAKFEENKISSNSIEDECEKHI